MEEPETHFWKNLSGGRGPFEKWLGREQEVALSAVQPGGADKGREFKKAEGVPGLALKNGKGLFQASALGLQNQKQKYSQKGDLNSSLMGY